MHLTPLLPAPTSLGTTRSHLLLLIKTLTLAKQLLHQGSDWLRDQPHNHCLNEVIRVLCQNSLPVKLPSRGHSVLWRQPHRIQKPYKCGKPHSCGASCYGHKRKPVEHKPQGCYNVPGHSKISHTYTYTTSWKSLLIAQYTGHGRGPLSSDFLCR